MVNIKVTFTAPESVVKPVPAPAESPRYHALDLFRAVLYGPRMTSEQAQRLIAKIVRDAEPGFSEVTVGMASPATIGFSNEKATVSVNDVDGRLVIALGDDGDRRALPQIGRDVSEEVVREAAAMILEYLRSPGAQG